MRIGILFFRNAARSFLRLEVGVEDVRVPIRGSRGGWIRERRRERRRAEAVEEVKIRTEAEFGLGVWLDGQYASKLSFSTRCRSIRSFCCWLDATECEDWGEMEQSEEESSEDVSFDEEESEERLSEDGSSKEGSSDEDPLREETPSEREMADEGSPESEPSDEVESAESVEAE